jgi:exodeoxyribonuclease VII small subunit
VTPPKEPRFEQAIGRLEEIVRLLDDGDLPLDDALKLFEEGVKLAGECARQLSKAQERLETLTKKQDGTLDRESLELQ